MVLTGGSDRDRPDGCRALEHFDSGTHSGLDLDDLGCGRVCWVDGLPFLINGSPSTDFRSRRHEQARDRTTDRCVEERMSKLIGEVTSISSFGVCAVSQDRPSIDLRIAMSAFGSAVRHRSPRRTVHPVVANQPAIVAFGAAPRLSEFDTEA